VDPMYELRELRSGPGEGVPLAGACTVTRRLVELRGWPLTEPPLVVCPSGFCVLVVLPIDGERARGRGGTAELEGFLAFQSGSGRSPPLASTNPVTPGQFGGRERVRLGTRHQQWCNT